jgi:hypothetical protein
MKKKFKYKTHRRLKTLLTSFTRFEESTNEGTLENCLRVISDPDKKERLLNYEIVQEFDTESGFGNLVKSYVARHQLKVSDFYFAKQLFSFDVDGGKECFYALVACRRWSLEGALQQGYQALKAARLVEFKSVVQEMLQNVYGFYTRPGEERLETASTVQEVRAVVDEVLDDELVLQGSDRSA